eukprot:gene3379-66877_t
MAAAAHVSLQDDECRRLRAGADGAARRAAAADGARAAQRRADPHTQSCDMAQVRPPIGRGRAARDDAERARGDAAEARRECGSSIAALSAPTCAALRDTASAAAARAAVADADAGFPTRTRHDTPIADAAALQRREEAHVAELGRRELRQLRRDAELRDQDLSLASRRACDAEAARAALSLSPRPRTCM